MVQPRQVSIGSWCRAHVVPGKGGPYRTGQSCVGGEGSRGDRQGMERGLSVRMYYVVIVVYAHMQVIVGAPEELMPCSRVGAALVTWTDLARCNATLSIGNPGCVTPCYSLLPSTTHLHHDSPAYPSRRPANPKEKKKASATPIAHELHREPQILTRFRRRQCLPYTATVENRRQMVILSLSTAQPKVACSPSVFALGHMADIPSRTVR